MVFTRIPFSTRSDSHVSETSPQRRIKYATQQINDLRSIGSSISRLSEAGSSPSVASSMTEADRLKNVEWLSSDSHAVRDPSVEPPFSEPISLSDRKRIRIERSDEAKSIIQNDDDSNTPKLTTSHSTLQRNPVSLLEGMSPKDSALSQLSSIDRPFDSILNSEQHSRPPQHSPSNPITTSSSKINRPFKRMTQAAISIPSRRPSTTEFLKPFEERADKIKSIFQRRLYIEIGEPCREISDTEDDSEDLLHRQSGSSTFGFVCRCTTMVLGSILFIIIICLFYLLESSDIEDQYLA